MKKIVVFGASGDTGKYFIKYFKDNCSDDKYDLIAVGTRKTSYFDSLNIPYYRVDICKKEDFDILPKDVYAVVDLAGLMPARMEGYYPQRYIDVNISGTLNILEYCRTNNVDRILYTQSFGDIKEYGEKDIVLKPDYPRKFSFTTDHTIYVMTKNFAVDLIENYFQMYGLKRFIFRLPTIYLYSPLDHYFVDGKIPKGVSIDHIFNAFNKIWDMCSMTNFPYSSGMLYSNNKIFEEQVKLSIKLHKEQVKRRYGLQ